ncbi:MAG: hypothetical protein Kow0069_07890 [Promethearchaeota archaeon]
MDWLIPRVARLVGTNGNALFHNLVYREMFRQALTVAKSEREAVEAIREVFATAARESADRHPQYFRFFPRDPEKALRYVDVLFETFFGAKIGPYERRQDVDPETGFDRYTFTVRRCPFCTGFGADPLDDFQFASDAPPERREAYACHLAGMIELACNRYVLADTTWRFSIRETGCVLRGDPALQITAVVYPLEAWLAAGMSTAGEGAAEDGRAGTAGEAPPGLPRAAIGAFDAAGGGLDLSGLSELLDSPVEKATGLLAKWIEKAARMSPAQVLSYFDNYEEDLPRVVGFLAVHLANEAGGVLERALSPSPVAKAAGYLFEKLRLDLRLWVPPGALDHHRELFLDVLRGLAPGAEEAYERFSGQELVDLTLEGARIALGNLGVQFEGLRGNVWEELREQGALQQEGREWALTALELAEEVAAIFALLLALPARTLIAATDAQLRATLEARSQLFDELRGHVDRILDLLGEWGDGA